MKVILASKSPRRRELLARLVPEFEIITKETDESLPEGCDPCKGVELLAVRKGAAVAEDLPPDRLVVSSDTLVEVDGEPLGKPVDEAEAAAMLCRLSDRAHNVHTGVAIHYRGRVLSGVATTSVRFRRLTDEDIKAYIASGEPMDKAGAYGIQGLGGKFVVGYDGDFDTVVGLSTALTRRLMERAVSDD